MEELLELMKEQYAYERERLTAFGGESSMGKCAMSRIHLMDKMYACLEKQGIDTRRVK